MCPVRTHIVDLSNRPINIPIWETNEVVTQMLWTGGGNRNEMPWRDTSFVYLLFHFLSKYKKCLLVFPVILWRVVKRTLLSLGGQQTEFDPSVVLRAELMWDSECHNVESQVPSGPFMNSCLWPLGVSRTIWLGVMLLSYGTSEGTIWFHFKATNCLLVLLSEWGGKKTAE